MISLNESTPLEAYAGLRSAQPSFLFESAGRASARTGRLSLAGRGNGAILWGARGNYELKGRGPARSIVNPLTVLGEANWAGALGYGLRTQLEYVPDKLAERDPWPDVALMGLDQVYLWDHSSGESLSLLGRGEGEGSKAGAAGPEYVPFHRRSGEPFWASKPVCDQDEAAYSSRVRKAQEYIKAGDIYQANLSLRFRGACRGDPFELYLALRRINPSPFAGFVEFPDHGLAVVSSSPERLVSLKDRKASTRPIAGTRPRGGDLNQDLKLKQELFLSEKERAEHVMLVDLERNDLGRVCEAGSVRVDELMVPESYSHVQHIVSEISGTLAPGRSASDLLRACFPGGTITGCPKVKCLEIIDELEPTPRGFYTGSMGYTLGPQGPTAENRSDWNILIRSIALQWDPRTGVGFYEFGAGAGIVADSSPEREYQECLSKAAAMAEALGHPLH